MLAHA